MASALWKVDTARTYTNEGDGDGDGGYKYNCPPLADLVASLPTLERITPPNPALR